MSADAELMFRPVAELAALVRAGELSASELVETSLRRIDALQPHVNAFVDVDHERALATAAAIAPGDERPFAGVPIAIKNNRGVAGLRLTRGARLIGEQVATADHNVTRRLARCGLGHRRHDDAARVGDPAGHRAAALRPHVQPVGSGAHARWLVGRFGGRRGRGDGAGRARQRRRRVDPHPGRLLRARRAQAATRPDLGRARTSARASCCRTAC